MTTVRFTEAVGRRVLDTTTAEEAGRVDGFAVDPANHAVHAVRIGKHKGGSVLRWSGVQALGPDALTVAGADAIVEPSDPLDSAPDLVGRRVLTDAGFELGPLRDVSFDGESGALEALHLDGRDLEATSLLGVGSWAIIVRHPDERAP